MNIINDFEGYCVNIFRFPKKSDIMNFITGGMYDA